MKIGVVPYSFGRAAEVSTGQKGRRGGRGEGGSEESSDSSDGIREDGIRLSPELDEAARQVVREMATRDREVRAHEAAHAAVGGHLAGSASFSFETGPDGQSYAVAGEVPIQMGEGGTPEQRIANARRVRAAALAPAQPSGADQAIASAAARMELEAVAELAEARKAAVAVEEPEPGEAILGGDPPREARINGEERPEGTAEERIDRARPRSAVREIYHQHDAGGASCALCDSAGQDLGRAG
jgi:hypothetical protein